MTGDGNVVVATYINYTDIEYIEYGIAYWKNARTLTGLAEPDWISVDLGGEIGIEALAVSNDGNHVVAVGTGPLIFYWNDALSIVSHDVNPTWYEYTYSSQLDYVSISDDGDIVAVVGIEYPRSTAYVTVYIVYNASHVGEYDLYSEPLECSFSGGLDLSGDGRYLVIACDRVVEYFDLSNPGEGALQLVWESYEFLGVVSAVDMSNDGNHVVLATNVYDLSPEYVSIYHDARSLIGYGLMPDYNFSEFEFEDDVCDVAISNNGDVIAFGTEKSLYVLDGEARLLGVYHGTDKSVSQVVKVSGNGQYVTSCGGAYDSVYFFRISSPVVGGEILRDIVAATNNLWLPLIGILFGIGITLSIIKRRRKT